MTPARACDACERRAVEVLLRLVLAVEPLVEAAAGADARDRLCELTPRQWEEYTEARANAIAWLGDDWLETQEIP